MVLYFPVSALVTLFGNILQNPLDPRARSDTKLMNVVVSFLSMLGHEAETGGVRRMLGVCSEFERIAKSVIEKTEKDTSRRKRKINDGPATSKSTTSSHATGGRMPNASPPAYQNTHPTPNPVPAAAQTPRTSTSNSATPQPSHHNTATGHLSPQMNQDMTPQNYNSPGTTNMSQQSSPSMPPPGWHQDFPNSGNDFEYSSFADMTGFGSIQNMPPQYGAGGGGAALQSPPLVNGFQQPMLPADLFSLPMTLDWDWAEMSGGAYPSVENGNYDAEMSR